MSEHDNDRIVRDFCDAWTRGDLDAIMGAFADDAVYHNIPMKPVEGKEAIAKVIGGFLAGGGVTFETHHQVAGGDIVMNERTDTITNADGSKALPVMGVFELADGKITAWRDYFDMKSFTG
jgi:limonene-1,2-epoxide hydrolase